MFKTFTAVLSFVVVGAAAEEFRTVELKHTVLSQYGALHAFGIFHNGQGNFIVLRGNMESVKAAEEFIKRFDVPRKSVEATLHVLSASTQAATGEKMSSDLEAVLKQLRNTFTYQGFRLLETVVLRSREGSGGRVSGALPTAADPRRTYNLEFRDVSISPGEEGTVIRFDRLQFEARSVDTVASKLNNKVEYVRANVTTDVDVREGQRVVIGKANLEGTDGPFFLIITARVVD